MHDELTSDWLSSCFGLGCGGGGGGGFREKEAFSILNFNFTARLFESWLTLTQD